MNEEYEELDENEELEDQDDQDDEELSERESERQTRSRLRSLFDHHGMRPRGKLGQNFLIDLNIIEFVVEEGELTERDVVLEVGTGTGGMTTFMAQSAGHVISVDVDQNMHRLARNVTDGYENITLITRDALKNKNAFAPEVLDAIREQLAVSPDRQLKLVANLPYSIATPVVSNLVATDLPWVRMIVTIQFELGLRMRAEPGDSNYGALSVWLQSQCFVKMIKKLRPNVFWPRPKVDSAIMRLSPYYQKRDAIADRPFYQDYLRRAFTLRRKLLRGVLCGMYRKQLTKPQIDEIMSSLGFDENTRAEAMTPDQHVELANHLYAAIHGTAVKEPAE
ncbi:MAG: ribosomal RNA small subunit methyltransferase A [Planctomycetaceae bacterium]|nr:ribosomal RNA small subunit methyltransferase A [Planctomycetaceae bacterium]MCB9953556.1 ribosomal RNA small subunit methyltransferase A [Planctomycetaceae bacterium]